VGSKFSDEQIASVLAAAEDGLTATQIREAAAAGTLRADIMPFAISASTARGHVARARREHLAMSPAGQDHADDSATVIVDRLQAILERELAALEKTDEPNLQRARELARFAAEVARARRATRNRASGRLAPADQAPDEAEDWLGALASRLSDE
jgi:hypothetical protein